MPDVLIPDAPDAVLAALDAKAAQLGTTRGEYIRRRLAADAATMSATVFVQDLRTFADNFADLAHAEVIDSSWR